MYQYSVAVLGYCEFGIKIENKRFQLKESGKEKIIFTQKNRKSGRTGHLMFVLTHHFPSSTENLSYIIY